MSSIPYTPEQVISFCKDRKYKIVILSRNDRKNQNFRASNGITYAEEQDVIRELTIEDLDKGPIEDRDICDNYLYVFHKLVCGKRCYIKLTIVDEKVVVKVISFHESEGKSHD